MNIRLLTSPEDFQLYDVWVRSHPDRSLWQSLEWMQFQKGLGREPRIYAAFEQDNIVASALVVIDRTTFGWSTWEIPRGPLMNHELRITNHELLHRIIGDAKKDGCISSFLSPAQPIHDSLFMIRDSLCI